MRFSLALAASHLSSAGLALGILYLLEEMVRARFCCRHTCSIPSAESIYLFTASEGGEDNLNDSRSVAVGRLAPPRLCLLVVLRG